VKRKGTTFFTRRGEKIKKKPAHGCTGFFSYENFTSGDRVPDDLSLIKINHIFGDVGGQVGNPLEVA